MRVFICLYFSLLLVLNLNAQYVDYGNDPAKLKWRQIKTEHYRVIFPANSESQGNLYANILENIHSNIKFTMSSKRTSVIPAILHPYNTHSNGMVAWVPKRMELLPAPNFDSRFQLPEYSLAVHESRHAAQLDRLNSGIFRPFHLLVGEQAMGLSVLFVPEWFLEGEAVSAETALSSSGRGRVASFAMPFRAQMATGKNYSYDKWLMGSYRDFTHDYYALGYEMTAYARLKYGADVWDKVLNGMTHSFPPLFAIPMRKYMNLSVKALYDSAFTALNREFPANVNIDKLNVLSPKSGNYVSYRYPVETELGIVSLKKSLYDIPSIVLTDSAGKECRLSYVGAVNSKLTYADGCVYWSEHVPGLRWTHGNYSVIKQLNIRTKKITSVSRRSRYFAPAVFSDGTTAAFEYTPDGQSNVVIINKNGEKLKSVGVLRNLPVQDMVADKNGNIFAAITGEGNGIFKLDTLSAQWSEILPYRRTNIETLGLNGGNLIFESGYNGIDNIYSMDTLTRNVKRLTNSRFGAFDGTFSADGSRLYLSDYTAKGYKIASVPSSRLNGEPTKFDEPRKFGTAEALSAQESYNIDAVAQNTDFNLKTYTSKPYRKGLNLFNFHSWFPAFFDIDEVRRNIDRLQEIKPGLTLLSQNRLNTLVAQVSYFYNTEKQSNNGFVSLKYTGLFPVFQAKAYFGGERQYLDAPSVVRPDGTGFKAVFLTYLPFNFTDGHYIHGLQPYIQYKYTNDRFIKFNRNYQYFNGGISYYRYRASALRDIFPKFGWRVWMDYVGNLGKEMGQLFISKANIYLPGILPNHGLKTTFVYQKQYMSADSYFFPEKYMETARNNAYNYLSSQAYTVKGDYSFPIFYPDLNLGSLLYFKRIRGNLFYDFTESNNYQNKIREFKWERQHAYGLDITVDLHALRFQLTPIAVTLRMVKTQNTNFTPQVFFEMSI